MKTNISQHLWSQRFESITERITSSLTVCLSNCTKHQLWSVRNLQPKHEGVLAGLTEILPKNTRMMCERCWHFRSYCFPQGISTVAALQCGLVTAGPRGLPFPLLPVAVILTICGLIWKSWPVSFHPKEDFVCKMGFHGSGIILISLKKKNTKKGAGGGEEHALFYCFGQSFLFQFHFSFVTTQTVSSTIFLGWKKSHEK